MSSATVVTLEKQIVAFFQKTGSLSECGVLYPKLNNEENKTESWNDSEQALGAGVEAFGVSSNKLAGVEALGVSSNKLAGVEALGVSSNKVAEVEDVLKENQKGLKASELLFCDLESARAEINGGIPTSRFYKKPQGFVEKDALISHEKLDSDSTPAKQKSAMPKTKRKKRKSRLCMPPRRKRAKVRLPCTGDLGTIEIHFPQKRHYSFDSGVDISEEQDFCETDILVAIDSYDSMECLVTSPQVTPKRHSLFGFPKVTLPQHKSSGNHCIY